MYGYIYKTVNLINKKIYIGQKKSTIFLANKYLGSGKYLKNALNKYGAQNFKVYLIEECSSKQILNDREIYWISYYKKNGYILYNISSGGDGGDTYLGISDQERQRRTKRASETCYFRSCTPEDRQKAWKTRRKNGTDKFSESQKAKQSKSLKKFYKTKKGLLYKKEISQRNIEKGLKTKQKFIEEWNSQPRYCQTCGILLTKIYGNGKYCSKSCSCTHKHTQETKELLSKLNKEGICGNKGKLLSKEHKLKISKSHKGKGIGKKFYTNDIDTICIYGDPPKGFRPGRKPRNKPAWNKGLKLDKNTRKFKGGDDYGK